MVRQCWLSCRFITLAQAVAFWCGNSGPQGWGVQPRRVGSYRLQIRKSRPWLNTSSSSETQVRFGEVLAYFHRCRTCVLARDGNCLLRCGEPVAPVNSGGWPVHASCWLTCWLNQGPESRKSVFPWQRRQFTDAVSRTRCGITSFCMAHRLHWLLAMKMGWVVYGFLIAPFCAFSSLVWDPVENSGSAPLALAFSLGLFFGLVWLPGLSFSVTNSSAR